MAQASKRKEITDLRALALRQGFLTEDQILEQIGDGGGQLGDSMEMEAPSMEETDLEQPELTDTLTAITDAIAAQAAIIESPALYAEMAQKGGGSGDGCGVAPSRHTCMGCRSSTG